MARSVEQLLEFLTPEERAEAIALIESDPVPWRPLEGPQTDAFNSQAHVTGYGGAAGGGKTDLACGLAVTQHQTVGIFRQNGTELTAIIDRLSQLVPGGRASFNGAEKIWRFTRYDGHPVQIELGSFPNPGDEVKYQGRPHDLLVFDEASNMRESVVRYVMGWLRTTAPGQRWRALMTFNPPTTVEGRWIVDYFGPWLDKKHPNPAEPGELRWFATVDGEDVECDDGTPFEHEGETITPLSRTFIPSRVADNPFLMGTGYMSQLQSLPEPLRSQMLHGDFQAGVSDDPFQVIPTEWVEIAMDRWEKPVKLKPMDTLGVDVARAGEDETIIARRHGMWFDEPLVYPGAQTPDGPTVAALCIAALRDRAVIHIDVIGVGSSPFDFLMEQNQQVVGVNVAEASYGLDQSGLIRFSNLRSELWWRFREALDPKNNTGICLPPNKRLLADLCAPTWQVTGRTIAVLPREKIKEKIGRSPDYGSAFIMALIDTPKRRWAVEIADPDRRRKEYDPYRNIREED